MAMILRKSKTSMVKPAIRWFGVILGYTILRPLSNGTLARRVKKVYMMQILTKI